ncbi:MAG TPA: hypothetical protein VHK88_08645, partial [Aquihabitans sp.]|nr:hypothetical protein [Aquihabitans sp.]
LSVRTADDAYFRDELAGPEVTVVHTRVAPPGSSRPAGRLALADLPPVPPDGLAFVCGSNGFADAATDLLQEAGVAPERIRVERFGATA